VKNYQFWFLFFDHFNGAVVDVAHLGSILQLRQDVFLGIDEELVHGLDLFGRIDQEGSSDVGAVRLVTDAKGAERFKIKDKFEN
jgi:hypothetical protein